MTFAAQWFVLVLAGVMIGCSDPVRYEHNFGEHSDADYDFRTVIERQQIIDELEAWSRSQGFANVPPPPSQSAEYLLEPDPTNPKFYARLFYKLTDNPGANQFRIDVYLKTDRWGDEKAHSKQEILTNRLHSEFRARFTGNY
ncbi:MAG: hypothetical protein AAGJ31_10425 [Verrucomicrobiota bacterium]